MVTTRSSPLVCLSVIEIASESIISNSRILIQHQLSLFRRNEGKSVLLCVFSVTLKPENNSLVASSES
jgi:hypothetical protein